MSALSMGGLLRFLRPAELAPDGQHHGDETGGAADHVGDGFRHEDAVGAEPEEVRQEVGQRNDDDRFPEQREEDGLALFVERLEGRLSAVLQPLSDEGEEVELIETSEYGNTDLNSIISGDKDFAFEDSESFARAGFTKQEFDVENEELVNVEEDDYDDSDYYDDLADDGFDED